MSEQTLKAGAVCIVCEKWYPADKIIYGIDPEWPTHPPDHWCKMHAKMYHIDDLVVIKPKKGGSNAKK